MYQYKNVIVRFKIGRLLSDNVYWATFAVLSFIATINGNTKKFAQKSIITMRLINNAPIRRSDISLSYKMQKYAWQPNS